MKASFGSVTSKIASRDLSEGFFTRLVTRVVANRYFMSETMCREYISGLWKEQNKFYIVLALIYPLAIKVTDVSS